MAVPAPCPHAAISCHTDRVHGGIDGAPCQISRDGNGRDIRAWFNLPVAQLPISVCSPPEESAIDLQREAVEVARFREQPIRGSSDLHQANRPGVRVIAKL